MASQFVNLPAIAGNGVGAAVDVSSFGAVKTIVVQGVWPSPLKPPTINIEMNNDAVPNGSWATVVTFRRTGVVTVKNAARWMRVRTSAYKGGPAPDVNMGGTDSGSLFVSLPVPLGNGVGAAVDVSALGLFKTLQIGNQFIGSIILELSEDAGGVDWAEWAAAQAPGQASNVAAAYWARIKRVGVPSSAAAPIVSLGGTDISDGDDDPTDGNKGDITVTGSGTIWTLNNGVVTLAKMADLAADRFLGRANGAGTGAPQALTPAQANTILPVATATVKGLVPTPPNNTTTFLRGDATFAAPSAGVTTKLLLADYTNATMVGSEVAGLATPLAIGTYQFKVALRWQSNNAAGGLAVAVNFDAAHAFLLATGTFPIRDYTTPGEASQVADASTGNAVSQVYSQRAASVAPVSMAISVDLANADQLAIIEGIIEVTAPGNLELWLAAAGGLTTITAKAGSSITAIPVT